MIDTDQEKKSGHIIYIKEERRMKNGEWRTENGERRMENGE
ncbi:hypothetical protein HMPREF1870_01066 [Bacteroidales bacterium KA00344]|nr:hypothetical protein HMPREF1870_01066 [Bacteroidales bacterium KA00344]